MDAFYALEPRWLGWDRFYKIYLTEKDIRGALLGKQVYDEDSALRQLVLPAQLFAPLMRAWANRIVRKVCLREKKYDEMYRSLDVFLKENRSNFRIPKTEICRLDINKKKRLWTGAGKNRGTLRLQFWDQSEREWIIVGDQDLDSIVKRLAITDHVSYA